MKFSDAEIDKISLMRDEGKTTKEIAEAFGMKYRTMTDWIDRLIKAGEIGKLTARVRWTEELVSELIRMKDSGATVEEMTKRLGTTFNAIRQKTAALVRAGKLPREYNSWKENKLYDYLDAHNLCHMCFLHEKFHDKQLCPECLERHARNTAKYRQKHDDAEGRQKRYALRSDWIQRQKEQGLCIYCKRPATHGNFCYDHYLAHKRVDRKYKQKKLIERVTMTIPEFRKANRLCLLCGSPIEDGNNTYWCNTCREVQGKRATASNARLRAEGRDFKFGRRLYEQTQEYRRL